jgi:predicted nucleic acid-binding protein
MREVFVDTSAWAAITDSKDTNHIAATSFMKQLARKSHLVITSSTTPPILLTTDHFRQLSQAGTRWRDSRAAAVLAVHLTR